MRFKDKREQPHLQDDQLLPDGVAHGSSRGLHVANRKQVQVDTSAEQDDRVAQDNGKGSLRGLIANGKHDPGVLDFVAERLDMGAKVCKPFFCLLPDYRIPEKCRLRFHTARLLDGSRAKGTLDKFIGDIELYHS